MVIDRHEFTVLIEASWHAGTILRHSIMEKGINVWYHEMSEEDRVRVYEFFNRTKSDPEDRKIEIQQKFLARYNPDNQYVVQTKSGEKYESTNAYKFDNQYFINTDTFLSKGHTTNVDKKPWQK